MCCLRYSSDMPQHKWLIYSSGRSWSFTHRVHISYLALLLNSSFLHQLKASSLSSHWMNLCLQVNNMPLRPICAYLSRGMRNSHAGRSKWHSASNYWLPENVTCSWEFKMISRAEIVKFVELLAKRWMPNLNATVYWHRKKPKISGCQIITPCEMPHALSQV